MKSKKMGVFRKPNWLRPPDDAEKSCFDKAKQACYGLTFRWIMYKSTFQRVSFDKLDRTILSMFRSNKASILELVEARKIVETAVVELAAQRATPKDLKAVRATIDAARQSIEAGDFKYGPHSAAFHSALARAAKNRVLNLTVQSFLTFFPDILEKLLPTADMAERAIADHTALYDAIESRNHVRARQLMSEHLAHVERKIMAFGESTFEDSGRTH
jgi:DNA-binding FadR family transcriptional regulator